MPVLEFCGGRYNMRQFTPRVQQNKLQHNITHSSGVVNLLQQDGIISTEANGFLKSSITEIPDNSTFQEFTDKLNILDNSFKQQTIYKAKENEVISGIFSVYKNSAAHWNDYFGNDNTITPSGRFRLRCFLCVVWQDIKGAAIGYLIGTCICRGIGVPNSAVCGAIGATNFGGLYSWAGKVCPGVCTRCRKPNSNNYPARICQLPLL